MTRPFVAETWFLRSKSTADQFAGGPPDFPPNLPDSIFYGNNEQRFSPDKYLISGWNGEGLFSKQALAVKKMLHQMWQEARLEFNSSERFPKQMRHAIFEEFSPFLKSLEMEHILQDNFTNFWKEIANLETSTEKCILQEFINIFSFRVVTTYLYKIRFLIQLSKQIGITLGPTDLLNPNSFLTKIFRKGSSTELYCEALQVNHYNWYRPSQKFAGQILHLVKNFHLISITEMTKICTYSKNEGANENHFLEFRDSEYSHALSNKYFGSFLNSLLINLPDWINADHKEHQHRNYFQQNKTSIPQILNTKYVGNFLNSLALSHWLAQENNIKKEWTEILSPDFKGNAFSNGQFLRNCNELQFLTLLTQVAGTQQYEPVPFVCQVMKERYSNDTDKETPDGFLLPMENLPQHLSYDRIVLNLFELPKTNPHFHMIAQIHEQANNLKSNGHIYVLTNQKLFVPSQSQKVESLLNTFKLEVHFNLENLKGKGEIPSYLYVFTKRKGEIDRPLKPGADALSITNRREACRTFRWTGELNQFHKFNYFVDELHAFFSSKNAQNTPLYQRQLISDLSFDFHRDAIIDGKLLQSTSSDSSIVTHSSFFKNITHSCTPLERFFIIETLASPFAENGGQKPDWLGMNTRFKTEHKYSVVLVVDYSMSSNIRVELIPADTYRAKFEEYGSAYFQYFGLIPKIPNLNINLFKEYFATNVGVQLIQMTLGGGSTKIKGRLSHLPIPKFFSTMTQIPSNHLNTLSLLLSSTEKISQTHPAEMESGLQQVKTVIKDLTRQYPWHTLGLLSYFKNNLDMALERLQKDTPMSEDKIIFMNPMIMEPLSELPTFEIFPKNPDVFVECHNDDYALPITKTVLNKSSENSSLEIYSKDTLCLKMFSHPRMLIFIDFIISGSGQQHLSTGQILKGLEVPALNELISIIDKFFATTTILADTRNQIQSLISDLLISEITNAT